MKLKSSLLERAVQVRCINAHLESDEVGTVRDCLLSEAVAMCSGTSRKYVFHFTSREQAEELLEELTAASEKVELYSDQSSLLVQAARLVRLSMTKYFPDPRQLPENPARIVPIRCVRPMFIEKVSIKKGETRLLTPREAIESINAGRGEIDRSVDLKRLLMTLRAYASRNGQSYRPEAPQASNLGIRVEQLVAQQEMAALEVENSKIAAKHGF